MNPTFKPNPKLSFKWIIFNKVYDTNSATLDLSNWSGNTTLMSQGMQMSLNRAEHMALLVRILKGFPIEAMTGLNLSSNKMKNLQQLEPLVEKIPALKDLKLAGNNFRCWEDLKVKTERHL